MDCAGGRVITEERIDAFERFLVREEKSRATREKYLRDIKAFYRYLDGREVSKETAVCFKEHLKKEGYKPRSINSMLASLNSFFRFAAWGDCRVKSLKLQRQSFCEDDRMLTKEEYRRLLAAAVNSPRLCLLLQTICGTGIRVSELQFFTVEAVRHGEVRVDCKGKNRTIIIPGKLRSNLLHYARQKGIRSGVLFRTRSGRPLDRSNIWAAMKRLCRQAGVASYKVFPHNLRKLFARCFYDMEKDISRLADILGHSSIDTTRIYVMTTKKEQLHRIERLELVI
ncbi:MAG: tyrosine-type recombinase/integrase [Oscillospiraceae bacterium]|nr:tyrosine-type recombinase/integrase [Oscillospiraceae bacterium]